MADLQQTVERVEAELNERRYVHNNPYDLEVGEHSDGPAIDVTKGGEAPDKVVGTIFDAAFDAGYIVSGVNRHTVSGLGGPHTRLFLRPVEEKFDHDESDDLGSAMAGMLFALMALNADDTQEDGSENEDERLFAGETAGTAVDVDADEIIREMAGVETAEKVVEQINENGGHAHVSSRSGWEGYPYAYTEYVDEVPDGWERCDEHEDYLVKK